jgi:erythronate-4-phosphate dehydrogenase
MAASLLKLSHESGFALKDKILGIIGAGNVGSKVEKFARALGMTILLNDPPRARREGPGLFTDLKTVLQESDIVTLHVPLNFVGEDFTYHLINEGSIKNMKKGVWFINTSRGEVAETSALEKAIDTGRFSGVILDVWENEPDIDKGLMRKAFIATPHIAGYSADGKANGTAMVVNAIADYFSFPINKWYPQQIPGPQKPFIFLDGKGKNEESAIGEAIARTYDIAEDDKNLRLSPADFEKLRGDYPVRREFPFYEIKLTNGTAGLLKMFGEIGFKI